MGRELTRAWDGPRIGELHSRLQTNGMTRDRIELQRNEMRRGFEIWERFYQDLVESGVGLGYYQRLHL